MNDISKTLGLANHNGPRTRLEGSRMAQSPTARQMPIGAVAGHSGGTDCGNEAGK